MNNLQNSSNIGGSSPKREGGPSQSKNISHQSQPFDVWLETEIGIHALEWKGLSRREIEVMTWVARGKANGEIGQILHISPRTVSKHLENIYGKLGVECRTAAVVYLLEIMQESNENQEQKEVVKSPGSKHDSKSGPPCRR